MTEIDLILVAREERDLIKKEMLKSGNILISMNLNVPGYPKSNPTLHNFFQVVLAELKKWLLANRINVEANKERVIRHDAGDFYIVPVSSLNYKSLKIKQITEQFESTHPLGRFIDVDITDETGINISSGKSKKCFYCGKYPAIECRRTGRHDIEVLRKFQQKKIKAYLKKERQSEICRKTSSLAVKAILYEISLTPKPGLVDKNSNGAHPDMDYKMFIDSSSAISTHFYSLVKAGMNCKSKNLISALPLIRQTGIQMEKEMFEQTNGINSQKGLIFLMCLSLFASGYILKKKNSFTTTEFRKTIKTICKNLVNNELNKNASFDTHGEKCFNKYRVAGIRKEVESGFPTVFDFALPILEKYNSLDDKVLTLVLLAIMSKLDDTNILHRSDSETLEYFKQKCEIVSKNYSDENYQEIIDFCISKNISPGGSADLLSISVLIFLMTRNFQ